jgi:regulator of replication initiation timing
VGQGLVLPGLEPAASVKRSKKKPSKKSTSSATLPRPREPSSAGIAAAAEVFARTLAEKDEQIENLKREMDTMREELAAARKSGKKLRHRLDGMSTCMRCGADVKSQKDVGGGVGTVAATNDTASGDGLAVLVAAGYRRDVLLRFQKIVRSIVMRRRFRKVALDFKRHKASLVMRLRNEALREILTSEQKYVDALQLAVDEFLQPMLRLSATRSGTRPVVTRGEVMDIFSMLEIIVELNRGLLSELKVGSKLSSHFFSFFVLQRSGWRSGRRCSALETCSRAWRRFCGCTRATCATTTWRSAC